MKKLIGIAAVALLAAGCSGSDNGSSGSTTTTTGTTSHTTSTGGNTTGSSTGTTASNTSGTTGSSTGTTASNTGGTSASGTATNGTSASGTATNGTGTTGGGDNVTGTLGFTVGKTIALDFFKYPDGGGADNTVAEIDMTDDATDSCSDDYALPDGGAPAAEHYWLSMRAHDPNGVTAGTAYQSLSVGQWNNGLADGGGTPATNLQAVYYNLDTGDVYVAVNGTATFNQDASQNPTISFQLTMGKANTSVTPPTVSAAGTSQLTGAGTAACAIGLIESGP
ncbi:MAG: hypothetical protein JST54_16620 [Deltaproteobacteria bacterium]|nr:hypothetical protein [Deltaproteobacteria bacterium]